MNKKSVRFTLLFLIIALPLLMYFIDLSLFKDTSISSHDLTWHYLNENSEEKDITLPIKIKTSINEERTIYTYLPSDTTKINALSFRSIYQTVLIKVDDEVVYEYSKDSNKNVTFAVSKKMIIVDLPDDISGKKLSVTINSPFTKYSGYFSDLYVGESIELVNTIYTKELSGLVLSLVIIFLNLSFIFANLLLYKIKKSNLSLLYMFLSGLFLGLWLLGDCTLITLYINNYFSDYLSYLSISAFVVILSMYLKTSIKSRFTKTMFYVSIGNIVLQHLLHLLGLCSFVILMPINILLIFTLLLFYLLRLIKKIINKQDNKKIEFLNLCEIVLIFVLTLSTVINMILQNVTSINFNSIIGMYYFIFLIIIYVKTTTTTVKAAESSEIYKVKLRETKEYLMQSQMKPHFIFNTLGAIRTLIMSDPKVAYEMTTNFSKYLRSNISTIEPWEKISFTQELDHIKAYVAIEKQRFLDRVNVIYDIETEGFFISPLSVEPLVENAIKHGVCKRVKGGTVKISSKEYEDRYEVIVEDNGVGFDTSILETNDNTKSVGLKYIILRLKELSDADFSITSIKGKGTKAVITIRK